MMDEGSQRRPGPRGCPAWVPERRRRPASRGLRPRSGQRLSRGLAGLLISLGILAGAPTSAAAESFKVIVNDSNPVESLRAGYVSQLFLNKISKWEHGERVKPVDRSARSATRIAFSKSVHGRPVRAIKSYWQQMIFTGRSLPPVELGSDAEVIDFVRNHPGAIGYVSEGAALEGVKTIEIRR